MSDHKATKYMFLLALEPGEEYVFDNKPTLTEARNHASASKRSAYRQVAMGTHVLRKNHNVKLKLELRTSKGSRIDGNKVVVTMLSEAVHGEEIDKLLKQRQNAVEAWRKKKQAEEAPLLPDQLAQAECTERAKRTAGAVRAQMQRATAPKYDPAQVALLVTAQIRGETIQQSYLTSDDGEETHREWRDQPKPTWTEPTAHYRIKPAGPRQWYLVVGRTGNISAAADNIAGLPHHDPECRVLVREVKDEE